MFDKTGTLTQAKLDILSFATTHKWAKLDAEFWTYVCAVEEHSVTSHPIGRDVFAAGVAHLNEPWMETKTFFKSRNIGIESGKGISGDLSIGQEPWRRVTVGNLRHLQACGVSGLPEPPRQRDHGVIAVYVGIDEEYAGTLLITVRALIQSCDEC